MKLRFLAALALASGALVSARPQGCVPPICDVRYQPDGWVPRLSDPAPGVESCVGFPDKYGAFYRLAYRHDATRAVALTGDFAVLRYVSYVIDFWDGSGEYLRPERIVLDDLDATSGEPMRPLPGSCNPAAVSTPASPLPPDCAPRAFAIVLVDESIAAEVAASFPDVNVVAVPSASRDVHVLRRVYLEAEGYANVSPEPVWCDTALGDCLPLGDVTPRVRLEMSELGSVWGSGGQGPPDPCEGAAAGTCDAEVPLYFLDSDTLGRAPGTHYISTALERLGNQDVVVFTHPQVPSAATQYPLEGALAGDEPVRYWSYCMGYVKLTTTFDCFHDGQVPPGTGSLRVVIGPSERMIDDPLDGRRKRFEEAVRERGEHPLRWGERTANEHRILLYRNSFTKPGFEGNFDLTTPCPPTEPESCVPASAPPPAGLGGWSPIGKHCTVDDYLLDSGACDVP